MRYGSEYLSYLIRLWKILPDQYKEIQPEKGLKAKIKIWEPGNHPRRLSKTYIEHVGFL